MGCAAAVAVVAEAVADVGTFFAGMGGAIAGGLGIEGSLGIGGLTAGGLIGTGLEGATIGGLGGGLINAVTGKPILSGVGEGALLGGATGVLGPLVGGVTGLGATAADALAGAGVGAAGSAAFGGNPLTGALTGGAMGALSGALSSGATGGTGGGATDAAGVGTGAGASGTAAPASVGAPVNLGGGDTFGVEAPSSPAIGGGLPGATVASALPGTPISAPDAAGLQSQLALSQSGGPSQLALSQNYVDTGTWDQGGSAAPATGTGGGASSGATGGGRPGIAPVDPVYDPASQTWGPGPIMSGATPGEGGYAGSSGSSNSTYGDYSTPGVSHLLGASDPIVFSNAPSQSGSTDTGGGSSGGGGSHTNWSNFSNAPFGTLADAVGNNAAPLIAGGGLALSALRGNTPMAGQGALSAEAASLAANGATLQGYLSSGTLPAGVQQSIVQATDAAKASIRSRYAAMGQSGSSAEMQDLASVDQHAATQGATIATQLLNTGISETGLSEQIYANLLTAATQQNAQLGQAIGNFATSLAPSRPVVLQTQGSS